MSRKTTLEDRLQIVGLAEAGLSDRQIAERTRWSVHTVRKWRRRGQRQGRVGLASAIGRPRRGALSSYPARVRDMLIGWRKAHPGWGSRTLHAELRKSPALVGQAIPSPASIGRLIREQGLSRRYEKHSDLPRVAPPPAGKPHQVWEMDARGHSQVSGVGVVSLVNINDRCSHGRLLSYPVWLGNTRCQRQADADDYQAALRLAFTEWGLPVQLQVDHDQVFFDHQTRSPFPTRIHQWLMALDVGLVFGRFARPTDQAMTERSHQIWEAQCLAGQRYADWEDLYLSLHRRGHFLNHTLPCASLNNQPPLVAFPDAIHSGRPYRPEWEADLLDLDRVWAYLAQGRWFRKSSKAYTFYLGGQVYYVGRPWQYAQLEITFNPSDQHLLCLNDAGDLVARLPIKGITAQCLMGSLAAFLTLPMFQLALPFEWKDLQAVRLCETISVRHNET
jgi:transposase